MSGTLSIAKSILAHRANKDQTLRQLIEDKAAEVIADAHNLDCECELLEQIEREDAGND